MPIRILMLLLGMLSMGLFRSAGDAGDDDDPDDDGTDDRDDRSSRGRRSSRRDAGDDADDDDGDGDDDDDGDGDDPDALKASVARLKRALNRQRQLNRSLRRDRSSGRRDAGDDDPDDDGDRDDRRSGRRSGRRDAGDRGESRLIRELQDRLDRIDQRERDDRTEAEAIKLAKRLGVSDDDADLVWHRIRRDVEYDEDGYADNLEDLIEELRDDKPHLFSGRSSQRRVARTGAGRTRSDRDSKDEPGTVGMATLRSAYAESERDRRRSRRR